MNVRQARRPSGCEPVRLFETRNYSQFDVAGRMILVLSIIGSFLLLPVASSSASTSPSANVQAPTTYLSSTFEAFPAGTVQQSDFNRLIGSGPNPSSVYKYMSIKSEPGHGKFVRTFLPKNAILNKPSGVNGAAVSVNLPVAVDNACIAFDVRFDSNFDWARGGKLPGLQAPDPATGHAPSGGVTHADGFSARIVWDNPASRKLPGPDSASMSYVYHPGQTGQYGDPLLWSKGIGRGTWQSVKQCFKMNTPGSSNGVLRAWIDDRLVLEKSAFTFRNSNSVKISNMSWSIFRGGNTMDYASPRDGYVDIDNLAISSFVPGVTPVSEPSAVPQAVGLRALANNQFVTGAASGTQPLTANREAASPSEKFLIENLDGDDVAIRSEVNKLYVCSESRGAQSLIANRAVVDSWETYDLIKNADGTVSLRSHANGMYVTAERGGDRPLIANRSAIGQWEKFSIH